MALPPLDGLPSLEGFSELDDGVATARRALLLFAEAERVLDALVCDPADPDCRYPDLRAARAHATVDDLLRVVARIPEGDGDDRGEEANALYPTLLELAEIFDILIDQHSLVYGDAVALAESIEPGWHAMAGCFNHAAAPEEATAAMKQTTANLATLPGVLDAVGRLSPAARRSVAERYKLAADSLWRTEARYLASHAADTWIPQGIADPRISRALEPARSRPGSGSATTDEGDLLSRATADLLLARLARGVARDVVTDVLEIPFEGLLPPS